MITLVHQQTQAQADGSTVLTFSVRVPSSEDIGGAREAEIATQQALNCAGVSILAEVLSRFDTDGEPLQRDGRWFTSKGRSAQVYQALHGEVGVERHVYQSAEGGATYCPLEDRARIFGNATCHYVSVIAGKYTALSGRSTQRELERSLQRRHSLDWLQTTSGAIGELAVRKEAHWTYAPQNGPDKVSAFALGIDGTCAALCDEGYRQVMAGTIALLDEHGERIETIYIANAPEEGKATFLARMEREVERLKEWSPDTPWEGVSDGAHDLQDWLALHCDTVTLDFYHLSEYLSAASLAFGGDAAGQQDWLACTLHDLKHKDGANEQLLRSLKRKLKAASLTAPDREAVEDARRYLESNIERTHYAALREAGLLIGSGITEAACKHIIKARVCGCGMKWKRKALQAVLSLRALHESSNRWEQFWSRIGRFGY